MRKPCETTAVERRDARRSRGELTEVELVLPDESSQTLRVRNESYQGLCVAVPETGDLKLGARIRIICDGETRSAIVRHFSKDKKGTLIAGLEWADND